MALIISSAITQELSIAENEPRSISATDFTSFDYRAENTEAGRHHLIRELKQPRRRRQQKPHKFAYLTMKNSIFARFVRAFFIF